MDKLRKHYSTGDWEFNNTLWHLDSGKYVSAPSSLAIRTPTSAMAQVSTLGLIKTTVVPIASVKEGRIVTWWQTEDATGDRNILKIIFRYQDADNYYYVKFSMADSLTVMSIYVYHRKAGVETQIDITKTTTYHAYNTWRQVRVTWWNDYVGLVIRVEVWSGSAWVLIYDFYHTNNEWKDIGGRIGLYIGAYYGDPYYFHTYVDDTEIYGIG